jgi:hypothetical protein
MVKKTIQEYNIQHKVVPINSTDSFVTGKTQYVNLRLQQKRKEWYIFVEKYACLGYRQIHIVRKDIPENFIRSVITQILKDLKSQIAKDQDQKPSS